MTSWSHLHVVCTMLATIPFYAVCIREWCFEMGRTLGALPAIAAACATCMVYAYDRVDDVNLRHVQGSILLVARASLIGFMIIALQHPRLSEAIFAQFYGKRIPYTNVRIKSMFPCSKTVFVPIMHVLWAILVSDQGTTTDQSVAVAMFAHFVILNVHMDIKDIKQDTEERTITFATILGRDVCYKCIIVADLLASILWNSSKVIMYTFLMDVMLILFYYTSGKVATTNRITFAWSSILPFARYFASA